MMGVTSLTIVNTVVVVTNIFPLHKCMWAYGVVVSMFDFHRSDCSSNHGRRGKIS